ncbi:MAG TPA: hypothetical protein VFI54_15605 [Solirubrobacteraceae bacterium]|nr:hypothetical protein [Solirubrobacteraceae bacterium]
MIEPARRAEIASIIVELYELSTREQQITQLLVRGLAIDEIAQGDLLKGRRDQPTGANGQAVCRAVSARTREQAVEHDLTRAAAIIC